MENAQKILKNTLLLTAASFLMQTVGVSFNVWLTSRLGEAGIGLFQLIMTVYALAVTLGCGGVRLASTRLAVEGEAKQESTRRTLRYCIRYALLTGTLSAVALYALSPVAARYWLADIRAVMPLKVLALSLPFVAMSSALNGYFTAVQKIGRYSAVRIAEQAVKIAIVVLLMGKLLPRGEEYGCVAIVLGILCSECFSFALLYLLYNIEKQKYSAKRQFFTLKKLLHIAVPDVTGAGARSILLTVEHLLIPRGFRQSGVSTEHALAVYGNIHGMVFPLLLYPSAILTSLSSLLIPEIAGHHALGQDRQIAYMQRRVLRMTLFFAFGTAGILYAFANSFSLTVYKTEKCTFYLQILAPLIPVMYCDMTVDGLLKGLDEQRASMRYNIFDSGLCVVLVYILLPRFAVKGYIFILFLSEIINFCLSMRRLCKVSTVELRLTQDVFLPLCCSICASSLIRFLTQQMSEMIFVGAWALAVQIIATIGVYVLFLYGFGGLCMEDIHWFIKTCGLNRLRTFAPRRLRADFRGKKLGYSQKFSG